MYVTIYQTTAFVQPASRSSSIKVLFIESYWFG